MNNLKLIAHLSSAKRPGRYFIEIPDLDIKFEHTYPENRLAKIFDLAGIAGFVEIFDGETCKLQTRIDIQKLALFRSSEGQFGLKRLAWTSASLKRFKKHAAKLNRLVLKRRNGSPGSHTPCQAEDAAEALAVRSSRKAWRPVSGKPVRKIL